MVLGSAPLSALLELRQNSASPRRRQPPTSITGHHHPHASTPILFAQPEQRALVWFERCRQGAVAGAFNYATTGLSLTLAYVSGV